MLYILIARNAENCCPSMRGKMHITSLFADPLSEVYLLPNSIYAGNTRAVNGLTSDDEMLTALLHPPPDRELMQC